MNALLSYENSYGLIKIVTNGGIHLHKVLLNKTMM